jgi:adenine-specific DNA methylase
LLTYIEFKRGAYILSILRLLAVEQETKREAIYTKLEDTVQADLFPGSYVISEYKLPSTKKLRDLMAECVFDASFNVAKEIMKSSYFKQDYVKLNQSQCIHHLRHVDSSSIILYFTE